MINLQETGVIILAAGSSSRLGQPKQLVSFKGKPLLQHMIDQLAAFDFGAKMIVLGAHDTLIKNTIVAEGFELLYHSAWQQGIGSSIRFGTRSILKTQPQLRNLLLLLSDQPLVNTALIRQLLERQTHHESGITACVYGSIIGVPAVFAAPFFADLQQLTGDTGARKIILSHGDQVQMVPFEGGAFDIDRPADLDRLYL